MDLKRLTKKELEAYIKEKTNNSPDMVYRDLKVQNIEVSVIYNEHVCNSEYISNFVVKSINNIIYDYIKEKSLINIENETNNNSSGVTITKTKERLNRNSSLNNNNLNNSNDKKNNKDNNQEDIFNLLKEQIYFCKSVVFDYDKDDLFYYIYSGFVVVALDNNMILLETRAALNRSITEPTNERSLKGPKDCFVENYSQNIGLIRKRIKEEKLSLTEHKVGRRSKTKVGVLYINDICKKELIDSINDEFKKIDIDGVFDSNTITEFFIAKHNSTLFPTVISTERPDLVSNYLLQGRIVIIVENSPFAIVFPTVIADFFKHMDDYYEKSNSIAFVRMIRYLAFFITLFVPAIYIAVTTFNQEALPTSLLVSFATQREAVPTSAFIEAILMIIAFEILREGDFRTPSMVGSTLSIVGALILGEAAVSAGIVSPVMIIVIAITTISGILFTDINLVSALRSWRIILLIFASLGGIIGIIVGAMLMIIKMVSIENYGISFTYPFAPVDFNELKTDTIVRENISKHKKRSPLFAKNLTRLNYKGDDVDEV